MSRRTDPARRSTPVRVRETLARRRFATGITDLAAIAPLTLSQLDAADNAIVELSPHAGHQKLNQVELGNNKITTLDPGARRRLVAAGCPQWNLTGNPLDAQTVTIALPALCESNQMSAGWDGGGGFTCDHNWRTGCAARSRSRKAARVCGR